MAGINVAIEDERPQQHLPVIADQIEDAVPIQIIAGGVDEVGDVSAIEAFAPGDEYFGRDEFLRAQDARPYSHDTRGSGTFDPTGVHLQYSVAHAGDEVHKVVTAPGFREPDPVQYFAAKSCGFQKAERGRNFRSSEEKVQVLSLAPDTGVLMQRKRAGDRVWHFL